MKKFIDQLMKKMTFEEKVGQLSQIAAGAAATGTAKELEEMTCSMK
jgi:leucyl aminopeptidase (aminopeptidase T)